LDRKNVRSAGNIACCNEVERVLDQQVTLLAVMRLKEC